MLSSTSGKAGLAMEWVIFATSIVGLIFGSFLNVVIHRGPAMWGLAGEDRRARGTLLGPRSKCPSCAATIRIRDLIPVVSYIALKGRCRDCAAPIALRYPVVEVLGAAAFATPFAVFGGAWAAPVASVFLLCLVALAAIDFETGYLPEAITLPLIALGLAANYVNLYTDFASALIGAVAGYVAFWSISTLYRRLRGREGLGLGDAALFSAIGAWGGWMILAPTALAASLLGLGAMSVSALFSRKPMNGVDPIAFGPALAAGGACSFLTSTIEFPWPPLIALLLGGA